MKKIIKRIAGIIWISGTLLLFSSVQWVWALPSNDPGPYLVFDIGFDNSKMLNGGAAFSVEIENKGEKDLVYNAIWDEQIWLPQAVNLAKYSGQEVKIRLRTIAPYFFSAGCWPFWGWPRIVIGPLQNQKIIIDLLKDKEPENYAGSPENRAITPAGAQSFETPIVRQEKGFHGKAQLSVFAHPFYWGGHEHHILEWTVVIPERPKEIPSASTQKSLPLPQQKFIIMNEASESYLWVKDIKAQFDPDNMRLEVKMGHKQGLGFAFIGFEAIGLRNTNLQIERDSYKPVPLYANQDNAFAGVVIDYHTPRGWSRRVWLNSFEEEYTRKRSERRAPKWNLHLDNLQLEDEVNREIIVKRLPGRNFETQYELPLSLTDYAPADWTGRIWFGIGIQDVGPDKSFAVTLTDINKP